MGLVQIELKTDSKTFTIEPYQVICAQYLYRENMFHIGYNFDTQSEEFNRFVHEERRRWTQGRKLYSKQLSVKYIKDGTAYREHIINSPYAKHNSERGSDKGGIKGSTVIVDRNGTKKTFIQHTMTKKVANGISNSSMISDMLVSNAVVAKKAISIKFPIYSAKSRTLKVLANMNIVSSIGANFAIDMLYKKMNLKQATTDTILNGGFSLIYSEILSSAIAKIQENIPKIQEFLRVNEDEGIEALEIGGFIIMDSATAVALLPAIPFILTIGGIVLVGWLTFESVKVVEGIIPWMKK